MKKDKKRSISKGNSLRNFVMEGKNAASKMIKKFSNKKRSREC